MTLRACIVISAVASAIGCAESFAAPVYSITELGTLSGATLSEARAINNLGQVVGLSYMVDGGSRAVLFSGSGSENVNLGTYGSDINSFATAINDNGTVVGVSWGSGGSHAILFSGTGSNNSDLGNLGGLGADGFTNSGAYGVNNAGQIVGESRHTNGEIKATLFSSIGGNPIDLDPGKFRSGTARAINNGGLIGGTTHGYLLSASGGNSSFELGNLGGGNSNSMVRAISDQGQAVGYSFTVAGDVRATIFSGTGVGNIDLGSLGYSWSAANDINSSGHVVGELDSFFHATPDDLESFFWSPETGMVNLEDLIPNLGGWDLHVAVGINDRGQIAVNGSHPDIGYRALLLNPVPEPETYWLLGLGLACVAGMTRRLRVVRP